MEFVTDPQSEEESPPEIEENPLFDEELPEGHKSGFVALLGKPNVGKSTLLNHWMGLKVAAVTPKPQTTRTRLLGILTREDAQLIFVDTPGIHRPRTTLGDYMVETAETAAPDADLLLFMADLETPPDEADERTTQLIERHVDIPAILVLNKKDLLHEAMLEAQRERYEALGQFDHVVAISALQGEGTDELLDLVLERLPEGPRFYPADQLTDQPERFIASELIREQALLHLRQEVPHALAVLVNEFKERDNGVLYIAANIYTEHDSQKGIVIGRDGEMLKRIGSDARESLEAFFGQKVYVDLWVKVRKNWRTNDTYLRELGYR